MLAAQGLSASRILKGYSSVVKAYCAAVEILLTAAVSHLLLGTEISRIFPVAVMCVGVSPLSSPALLSDALRVEHVTGSPL
ncbi:hypothetical protein T484DRAFT_3225733 [Baffinella frigidus]|nr:hypothetical protein T484DRAFT_3225733 [Cryptophyta sp. CCMP2293]